MPDISRLDENDLLDLELLPWVGREVVQALVNRIREPGTDDLEKENKKLRKQVEDLKEEVADLEEASKIGRYHRAVREYTVNRNPDALREFEGITVRDSDGNDHSFETDLESVEDIDEKARANDFPVVYTGD